MSKLCLSSTMICLFCAFASNPVASQVFYQETIEDSKTYRVTWTVDGDGTILWEETLPGNDQFVSPATRLSYSHSIENIDPPLLPNGIPGRARLKLYLRNYSNDKITLVVDSLDLDRINRRHFLLGPNPNDTVDVEDSPLCDGKIDVELNSLGEEFVLYRSIFDLVYTPSSPTDITETDDVIPVRFELGVNYPNPFNPNTTIDYSLPIRSHVVIEIFDIVGRKVRLLLNETKAPGSYQITWDGTDRSGAKISTGIYLYRIQTDAYVEARKMLLLK